MRRPLAILRPSAAPRVALVVVLIVAVLAAAGCGTKQVTVTGTNGQTTTETVKNIHFANTKFVLHMGLAFGAFHRYIYKPLKYGYFRSGSPHRLRTLAKAALAAAFIVHELRIAHEDALASNQLRPLINRLDNLLARIRAVVPGLKGGSADAGAITGASGAVDAVGSQSGGLGLPIHDIAHAL
jgi:hypothetical protein